MIPHSPPDPLNPTPKRVDEAERRLIQILNHSQRRHEGLCCLGDGCQPFDLPSLTEVLTIEQCGYPRTFNLNDGMGLE
jgi:hypothetical protein